MNRTRLAWLMVVVIAAVAGWQAVVQAGSGQVPATLVGNWLWDADAVVFAGVAVLIITRQPRNTIGWLLLVFPLAVTLSTPLDYYFEGRLAAARVVSGALWWYAWFQTWSWWLLVGPVFLIAQLFPTGRPVSPRWRLGLVGLAAWFVFFVVCFVTFAPTFEFDNRPPIPNPVGIPAMGWMTTVTFPFVLGIVGLAVLSVAAIFVRYRRAGLVVREQIKWLVYALGVFLAIYVFGGLTATDGPSAPWFEVALPIVILLVPVAIAVAILRYRLWDIDLLIRRTLVYTVLSAVLALAYFGSVLVLQSLFEAVTGESRSALVTVFSTLLIAALFGPLRGRVQRAIDRRFYRQKYDAARTLAAFGAQARDVVELEQLSGQLMAAVNETMQPASVGLWLQTEAQRGPATGRGLEAGR